MPLESQHGIVLSHAAAIVSDRDQLSAAGFDFDADRIKEMFVRDFASEGAQIIR